jgi:TolB protein
MFESMKMMKSILMLFLLLAVWCWPALAQWRGGKVVFESTRDGNSEIYIMNSDGTNIKRLTHNNVADTHPVLSPNGQKIAFISLDTFSQSQLWTMNTDGSNLRQITGLETDSEGNRLPWGCGYPSWSFDGTKIVVVAGDFGGLIKLYLYSPDGSWKQNLGTPAYFDGCRFPEFSPDGKSVLYNADGAWAKTPVRVISLEGQPERELIADGFQPTYSPNGSMLAYNHAGTIWVANPDGTNPRNLGARVDEQSNIDFNNRSDRIVFSRDGDLWDIKPDGTEQCQLTSDQPFASTLSGHFIASLFTGGDGGFCHP